MSQMIDLFLVYSFIKRLSAPFEKWPAFKLGIIDAQGNELRKRSSFTKPEERQAYGVFDRITLRIKKLLGKLPAGQTRIGSYAAALWLMKESEDRLDSLDDNALFEEFTNQIHTITESMDVNTLFSLMEDGAIANNVGGGAIEGAGVGPKGEPGVSKSRQAKIVKGANSVLKRYDMLASKLPK